MRVHFTSCATWLLMAARRGAAVAPYWRRRVCKNRADYRSCLALAVRECMFQSMRQVLTPLAMLLIGLETV